MDCRSDWQLFNTSGCEMRRRRIYQFYKRNIKVIGRAGSRVGSGVRPYASVSTHNGYVNIAHAVCLHGQNSVQEVPEF